MLTTALTLVLALQAPAAPPVHRTDNLVKLAEVWATVKYLDPWMLTKTVDWDGALVRAIPKVRDAKTGEEAARAIGSMLAELNDPLTKVEPKRADATRPKLADVKLHQKDGDVLVVNLGPYAAAGGSIWASYNELSTEIGKAKAVVVDLRGGEAGLMDGLGLVATDTPVPPTRMVFHSGYAPQEGSTSGGYYTSLQTVAHPSLSRLTWASGAPPSRIVFVSDGADLSSTAAALWWSGAAAIVSEKPLTDDAIAGTRSITLADGWTANVRVSESTVTGLAADVVAPADAMAKALALARATTPFASRPPMTPSAAMPRRVAEKPYPEMKYPDLPHRLLALFRLWSVIDFFYPYKELIGDWDGVLKTMIPRFEEAKDEQEYASAIMEAAAYIEDGHTSAGGQPATLAVAGGAFLPGVSMRRVQNENVVIHTDSKDLKAGDVVVAVDGEPLAARIARLRKYITASTETARTQRILNSVLRGAENSEAVLTVRNDDGTTREVKVKRDRRFVQVPPRNEKPYRILDGNIGYADLTLLTVAEVDAMFDAFAGTKALLLDMRGYPKGTAWAIAPRINTKGAKYGASFRRAQVSAWSSEEARSGFFFDQPLPELPEGETVYTKPVAMIIDDRAISQSEHSGLFYEAANGTTFIGTPTAGANGDVTNFPLPGGYRVGFTGHDVRHADGRQLQRVGLQPHITAEPTIRGIREGKDEVLARAIQWANDVTK